MMIVFCMIITIVILSINKMYRIFYLFELIIV